MVLERFLFVFIFIFSAASCQHETEEIFVDDRVEQMLHAKFSDIISQDGILWKGNEEKLRAATVETMEIIYDWYSKDDAVLTKVIVQDLAKLILHTQDELEGNFHSCSKDGECAEEERMKNLYGEDQDHELANEILGSKSDDYHQVDYDLAELALTIRHEMEMIDTEEKDVLTGVKQWLIEQKNEILTSWAEEIKDPLDHKKIAQLLGNFIAEEMFTPEAEHTEELAE